MNNCLKLTLISLSMACLLACSASPEEQIIRVLESRKQGMEKKDIACYMSTVSPDYNDGENTHEDIRQKVAGYFSTFDTIELNVQDRAIYITGDQARVVEKYTLTFSLPSGKRTGKAEQLFILRREKDGWKIIDGLGK